MKKKKKHKKNNLKNSIKNFLNITILISNEYIFKNINSKLKKKHK